MVIDDSKTLSRYKTTIGRIFKSIYPHMDDRDISNAIDYSINKRLYNSKLTVYNNYTEKNIEMRILDMCDYIASKEPIITSYGVMFKKHGTVSNPQNDVIDEFLNNRGINKKKMFTFPKGSDQFEYYNLLQNLDKTDNNSVYGCLGLYVSFLFNIHVAPSITSMGRSLISSAICCFEMFLSNNVLFSNLNDIVTFIDNVRSEQSSWEYDDFKILDHDKYIDITQCFEKIILTCGYKYIPTENDLDIVWKILSNCTQLELNRLFYKNNLYAFMENSICRNYMVKITTGLDKPYLNPLDPPKEIIYDLNAFRDLLIEYVFYNYQIMDRIDRNKNMIKNISIISDTDSSFVSLDAWYHYNLRYLQGIDMKILHQNIDVVKFMEKEDPENAYHEGTRLAIRHAKKDEFGDVVPEEFSAIEFIEPELDFDFYNDEIIERDIVLDACVITPQHNLRFAIINIMAYILDKVINKYMIDFTKQSHSYRGDDKCRIIMKNEFYMYRILMSMVKKNYAALQMIQEGNFLGIDGVLSVTGIQCMTKADISKDTRTALKKILLKDIMKEENISQFRVLTDLAILEKKMHEDISSGSKKYYKPATIKSIDNYVAPLSEQGITSSIVWNYVKDDTQEALDLNERNPVHIASLNITLGTLEKIKDKYPDKYEKCRDLVDTTRDIKIAGKYAKDIFKGIVKNIAIPINSEVPEWLLDFIDVEKIILNNLSTFPTESLGFPKSDNKVNATYSNILKL